MILLYKNKYIKYNILHRYSSKMKIVELVKLVYTILLFYAHYLIFIHILLHSVYLTYYFEVHKCMHILFLM